MLTRGTAYADSFEKDSYDARVRSVRIGGIGMNSQGKLLRVKIVGQDGLSILDVLTWRIDAKVSPDLRLSDPIPSDSIGAVLIGFE